MKINEQTQISAPDFIQNKSENDLIIMDVRPILAGGTDPLKLIMEKVQTLQEGQILKIINTFEPIPLIRLLEKKGFESAVITKSDKIIETYFYKKTEGVNPIIPREQNQDDWELITERFSAKMITLDVRTMEMPLPMMSILNALEKLPRDMALMVFHKRIPVFLIPELANSNFDYRIKVISDMEVNLIIFHQ